MIRKNLLVYILGINAISMIFSNIAFAEETPRSGMEGVVQTIKKEIYDDRMIIASTTKAMRGKVASTTKDVRADIRDTRQNLASTTNELRSGLKNMRGGLGQLRVLTNTRPVWVRINATIIRLEKILAKLDSRITKIKANGGDTTKAEVGAVEARNALTVAKTEASTIKKIISEISSTTPLENMATSTIRTAGKNAETQIKIAQKAIESAIQNLKEAKFELKNNATTSSQQDTN